MTENSHDIRSNNSCIIFLAEDDVDDKEFLEEALHSINPDIKLVSFSSGLKFMNRITALEDQHLPQLIILDYNIPEINGAEILEQLKKDHRYSSIPKIVWSTSESQLYRENCIALGARAYMVKPSSIGGIKEIAKEMLGHC